MGVLIAYNWRMPKLMVALMILELPLTVFALVLFGVADPNTYRTKMWQDGANAGFNSNPNIIMFSYANYAPVEPPVVWSQYMTTFNVVISVLSMFILLVKATMFVMHSWVPLLSLVVHGILIALYSISLANQTGGDYLDPAHPSPRPWYLTHSCSKYASPGNVGYCYQARASVYCTAVMIILFTAYFAHAAWSAVPTAQEKAEREAERLADLEMKKVLAGEDSDSFEMGPTGGRNIFLNLPKTPMTPGFGAANPMTPRTTAFTKLNGGKAPEVRVTASSPSRALPFREHYGNAE